MRKPTIVVVEAFLAMRLLLDDVLTRAGYQVRLWPDCAGAFEFIRQQRPDLVILALSHKSHGDGLRVLDQLSAHQTTCDIPLIVFADDSLMLPVHHLQRPPSRFEVLERPFYLEQLMAKVQQIVGPSYPGLDERWAKTGEYQEMVGIHR